MEERSSAIRMEQLNSSAVHHVGAAAIQHPILFSNHKPVNRLSNEFSLQDHHKRGLTDRCTNITERYRSLWQRLRKVHRSLQDGTATIAQITSQVSGGDAEGTSSDVLLSSDLVRVCFGYLDLVSLWTCQAVAKAWYAILQEPKVWADLYAVLWRQHKGIVMPLPDDFRSALLPKFKGVCKQRMHYHVVLSSRAKTWVRRNGNICVHNDSVRRSFFSGCIESIRTEGALAPLACAKALDINCCYFEVTIRGCGSVGLVSISSPSERIAYGFGAEHHIGWFPVAYGYHGDDGRFYWNDNRGRVGGSDLAYGPTWGDTTPLSRDRSNSKVTIGCGYLMDRQQLFFTHNGKFLGFVPLAVDPMRSYAAAVSLHQMGDSAEMNFGRTAFQFDIEMFISKELAIPRDGVAA